MAIIGLIAINTSVAQEKLSKKEQRRLEKAEKRKEAIEDHLSMARDSSFIIEAHSIMGDNLQIYQVSPNTNFIKIEGGEFVLQTANNFGFGYNGLGGITITGDIDEYEVVEAKDNKPVYITARVSSIITGSSTLNIHIGSDGYATARLTDMRGNRITYNGQIYFLEESKAFEGQSIF